MQEGNEEMVEGIDGSSFGKEEEIGARIAQGEGEEFHAYVSRLLGEVIRLLKQYLQEYLPVNRHWYQTGEVTIATATAAEIYNAAQVHNLVTDLDFAARSGTIINHGPGDIWVAFSRDGSEISGNELYIPADTQFQWGRDHLHHLIYFVHIRSDTDNTKYQIMAGW